MSVSSINNPSTILQQSVTGDTQANDGSQASGKTAGASGKSGGGGGGSSDSSTTVTNTTQTVNADGTITVVTTYADGSTSSTTEPNPNPVTSSASLFSGSNSGQLSTLLNAQEQSQQGSAG